MRTEDVKQPQSNPLQRELARGKPTEPHPYEDVLAAFAEDTLLERERGRVIEHLSTCSQCREVLSMATATAPEATVQEMPHVLPVRPPLSSWLPWVAAAAVLLVASSALLLHERSKPLGESSTNQASTMAKTQSLGGEQSAVRTPEQGQSNLQNQASASNPPALSGGAAPGVHGNANSPGVRVHWRLDEAGHAERAFGDGTWQPVLANEKARMRVIAVSGNDVWVGGESPRLYHSADDGTTWHLVELPQKGTGGHAVTHIGFQSELVGTVQADDKTQWSTVDGGKTWK